MLERVFLGSSGDTYWAARLSVAGTNYSPNDIITDVNNNVYVCGTEFNPTIIKLNSLGAITWQRTLSIGSTGTIVLNVVVDTNNNVYAGGAAQNQLFIVKYDSNGTLQWQRTIGEPSSVEQGRGLAIDANNDLYLIGRDTSGSGAARIIKFDASGSVLWQRSISSLDPGRAIIAGDTNLYMSYSVSRFSTFRAGVAKYSNTGTLGFQNIGTDGGNAFAGGISFDNDNNIYVVGQDGNGIFLYKMNSSGTIQWTRFLTTGAILAGTDCHVDGTGVFVTGYTTANDGTTLYIVRYDLSGNLQWQRSIQNSDLRGVNNNIFSKNGTMFITSRMTVSSVNSILIFKLPNDGSLTGTITLSGYNFVYATSSLTSSNPGATSTEWGGTGGTTSFTAATSTYTSSASTLTANTVTL
jgi:hypothetical protein